MTEPLGQTYEPALDRERLLRQKDRVRNLMLDAIWRTLSEIEEITCDPQASISARLRDLRRVGYTVERRRRGEPKNGLFEYRVYPGAQRLA